MKGKVLNRLFLFLITIAVMFFVLSIYKLYIKTKLPECIYIYENDTATYNYSVPVVGKVRNENVCNFSEPITFIAGNPGVYSMDMELFGLFRLGSVDIEVVDNDYLYPGGFQVGLYLKCDGVLVVDTQDIIDENGEIKSPSKDRLIKGDYIIEVNGIPVESKNMLSNLIAKNESNNVEVLIRRDGQNFNVPIEIVKDVEGNQRIGVWIKDDAQGIGTVTFLDKNNRFAALGHGICDTDSERLLEINKGQLYKTKIMSIVKGQNGLPGELVGTIDYRKDNLIGVITDNKENGIYGQFSSDYAKQFRLSEMSVGYGYMVHTGDAFIKFFDGNDIKDFEIEIIEVNPSVECKNITFKVKDKDLINKTNGIIQGMSGCPIIQDNRIIGAVTHVFVDDSTCGYGIFIESMIE